MLVPGFWPTPLVRGDPVAVLDRLSGRGVPLVVDVPVGHGRRDLAPPLGAQGRLEAGPTRGTLRLGSPAVLA